MKSTKRISNEPRKRRNSGKSSMQRHEKRIRTYVCVCPSRTSIVDRPQTDVSHDSHDSFVDVQWRIQHGVASPDDITSAVAKERKILKTSPDPSPVILSTPAAAAKKSTVTGATEQDIKALLVRCVRSRSICALFARIV